MASKTCSACGCDVPPVNLAYGYSPRIILCSSCKIRSAEENAEISLTESPYYALEEDTAADYPPLLMHYNDIMGLASQCSSSPMMMDIANDQSESQIAPTGNHGNALSDNGDNDADTDISDAEGEVDEPQQSKCSDGSGLATGEKVKPSSSDNFRFTLSNALVRKGTKKPKVYQYWPGSDDNEEIIFHPDCTAEDRIRLTDQIERRKKEIEQEMTAIFGKKDAVLFDKKKKRYRIYCNEVDCDDEEKVCHETTVYYETHLQKDPRHLKNQKTANFMKSCKIRFAGYITEIVHHNSHKPQNCVECFKIYDDLRSHIKSKHKDHPNKDELRKKCEEFTDCHFYEKLKQSRIITSAEEIHMEKPGGNTKAKVPLRSKGELPSVGKEGNDALAYAKPLCIAGKKKRNIANENFKYYYEDASLLLHDYERYLTKVELRIETNVKQEVKKLRELWSATDPTMALTPCIFEDGNILEDRYFSPILKEIKDYNSLSLEAKSNLDKTPISPGTLSSRLGHLSAFLDFLKMRYIYAGLTYQDMDALKVRIQSLKARLTREGLIRAKLYREYKFENLITPADTIAYGKSDHVQKTREWMEKEALNDANTSTKYSLTNAWDARNYLVMMIVLINACRSSNICNITVSDVKEAKVDKEFPNARTIRSTKYKTSLLYGTKIMVLPLDIYNLLVMYVNVIRPILTEKYKAEDEALPDSERYLFQSHLNSGMIESRAVSSYLSRTVQKSKVLSGSEQNVSCSRLRTAIATEMAGYRQEDLKTFANCYMMHKETTSRKYYILNYSQREGVRCAMRCMNVFMGKEETETITRTVEKLMHTEIPKSNQVKSWITTQTKKHKEEFAEDLYYDEYKDDTLAIRLKGMNLDNSDTDNVVSKNLVSKPAKAERGAKKRKEPDTDLEMEQEDEPSFGVWREDQFIKKHCKFSREYVLKLVFIFGAAIEDSKCITKERWDTLVERAADRRLNVEDVKRVPWKIMRQTVVHWWNRYRNNATGDSPKLWQSISEDATSYWRHNLL